MVAQNTHVEELPDHLCLNRPWKRCNNSMTGGLEFLSKPPEFESDFAPEAKLQIMSSRWLITPENFMSLRMTGYR